MSRRSNKCSDCGTRWSDHLDFTPEPSVWSAVDFIAVVENEWQKNPNIPTRKAAYERVAPRLLWELAAHGLSVPVVRELTLAVWGWGETPGRMLAPKRWLRLFRQAGYTEVDSSRIADGQFAVKAPRPEAPTSLYRGAPHEWRNGLAWTTSRHVAEIYAYGRAQRDRLTTSVYEIRDVPADRILGRLLDSEDGDGEYIVNPHGLNLLRHEPNDPTQAARQTASRDVEAIHEP